MNSGWLPSEASHFRTRSAISTPLSLRTCCGTPCRNMASPAIETTPTPQSFTPTQAACCCSRLVALALDEEGLHLLVLQDLHGHLLGSIALRDREERLLRLRHHRARDVVLVDRVVFGRHGPVQQWQDVAKDARRVGVAENDGGTVQPEEVELDGLDSLLLLADDLRVLHPGLGVRARCCHEPAHTSTSRLGGAAKGLRVGDFDLAHLLLGHLRAALADAERGERDVDSPGVRRNLLLESVHVDNYP